MDPSTVFTQACARPVHEEVGNLGEVANLGVQNKQETRLHSKVSALYVPCFYFTIHNRQKAPVQNSDKAAWRSCMLWAPGVQNPSQIDHRKPQGAAAWIPLLLQVRFEGRMWTCVDYLRQIQAFSHTYFEIRSARAPNCKANTQTSNDSNGFDCMVLVICRLPRLSVMFLKNKKHSFTCCSIPAPINFIRLRCCVSKCIACCSVVDEGNDFSTSSYVWLGRHSTSPYYHPNLAQGYSLKC